MSAASIWFEIWRSWIWVKKKLDFCRQISQKFRFFKANFEEISIFPGKFLKKVDISMEISEKFRFFQAKFLMTFFFSHLLKNFRLSRQICHFRQNSTQIILFRLKSHHISNILPVHNKI